MSRLTLEQLQAEQKPWVAKNFGTRPYWQPLLGVGEECGELMHNLLKQEQGIRGSHDDLEVKAMDSVADIIIYLADLCTARGWDMQAILESTWNEVKQRDWTKHKGNGVNQ